MAKAAAWLLAGAVLATAGAAHAQEAAQPSERAAVRAEVPWYERFTTSNGLTENITGVVENDRALTPTWTLSQRWGVTVDVRQAERVERSPDLARQEQAAVGAYYQFTPRVRLGGEVSLGAADRAAPTAVAPETVENSAGVRIESAFKF